MLGAFVYVDYWHQSSGKKWSRHPLASIIARQDALLERQDIFTSIQQFERSVAAESERHICPLFFDLDSKEGVQSALADAQTIINFLNVEVAVPTDLIHVKFSGSRGFHIIVDPSVMAVRPSLLSTSAAKLAANEVCRELGIKSFDDKVYSKRRMLRIPNSRREKGQPAAIIPTEEFLQLEDQRKVFEYAINAPPPDLRLYDWIVRDPIQESAIWYLTFQDAAELDAQLLASDARGFIRKGKEHSDIPVCIKGLMEPRLRVKGTRNQATFLTAVAMRELGWNRQDATEALLQWTDGVHRAETGGSPPERVKANCRSTVRSAWTGERRPVCKAMLALGSESDPIPCAGPRCTFVHFQEEVASNWQPPLLTLDEVTQAERVGRRARVHALITRQDMLPSLMPGEVEITCDRSCKSCPLADLNGARKINVKVHPRAVTGYLSQQREDVAWKWLTGWAKAKVGISKDCKSFTMKKTENLAMLNVCIQPIVGSADQGQFRENDAIVPAHFLENHTQYELDVTPIPHPKTMKHVLVARNVKKLSRRQDDFELTTDVVERLKKFQTEPDSESVLKALKDLHQEYERMHGIMGRTLESIMISLTWHSVLSFRFRGRDIPRGWIECLVVGDTAQGKTELARSFMNWYGVSDWLSGENCTLPGLTVGVEQFGGRYQQKFGAFVRNDTGMAIMDEAHEIHASVMKGLSDCRSSGVARMDKIMSAIAQARCRKLFLANAINEKTYKSVMMDTLPFPCIAAVNVMKSPEDTRRLDYAIFMKRKQSLVDKMNSPTEIGCSVSQRDASDLVLWAWSRNKDQVIFLPETEKLILDTARRLALKYDCSIPLMDSGEAKIKLARVSAAVAAATFSCGDNGELVIMPYHVESSEVLFEALYTADDCQFDAFSATEKKHMSMTENDAKVICAHMHSEDLQEARWIELLGILSGSEDVGWSSGDLMAATTMSPAEIANYMQKLTSHRCLKKAAGFGFILTDRGKRLAKIVEQWKRTDIGVMGHVVTSPNLG